MAEHDVLMAQISEAIAFFQGGDREEARQRFARLWEKVEQEGDPLHRCTLAHFMADAQDDPHAELRWDLRALEAADALSDQRVKAFHGSLALASFYPSLHLNLAEDYRKLGRPEEARRHLAGARQAISHLPDDGYGRMIRMGIQRLENHLLQEAVPDAQP